MRLGKLDLIRESWDWGDCLEFRHLEIQQGSFYTDDEVSTEISVDDAKLLIQHLQEFINDSEVA